jgi:hypothetical protein
MKRRQSFCDIMRATEKLKRSIIKRLQPQGTAADAGNGKIGKTISLNR